MDILKPYKNHDIQRLTRQREGEEKIGEVVLCVTDNWRTDLEQTKAKYVIVGIPEDIGVRANYGRAGAGSAFKPALDSFLNQQNNSYLNGAAIFVLGEVYVNDLMTAATEVNLKEKKHLALLRDMVCVIDERVTEVIQRIVALNKIPIVIGGGHNNAYGCIKGSSLALNKKINVINCDPHLDFRPLEGRHSGNGFSYAYHQGYLQKYAVLAMHEQYNNQASLEQFKKQANHLYFSTYESVFVREEMDQHLALKQCLGFVKQQACGVEIDLDAITNVPSSAKTSSGLSPVQARQYLYQCALNLNALYLHIAEGAPVLSHIKADNKTGKLIAYLISDFIKGCEKRLND